MLSVRTLNISIELWGSVFCLVCIISSLLFSRNEPRYRSLLIEVFSMAFLSMTGDAVAGIFRGKEGQFAWAATHVGNFATFAAGYLLLAAVTQYLRERIDEAGGPSYTTWCNAVSLGAAVMCLCTLLGLFYTIDENNLYQRSDWYWLSQAFLMVCSLANAIIVLRNRKRFVPSSLTCLQFYTLAPLIASGFQTFIYGFNFTQFVEVVGIIVLFIEMQMHSSEILVKQTEELAHSRVALSERRMSAIVSQMQPNMMFDTLDAVRAMCDDNPTKAKRVLGDFSQYLRTNLRALQLVTPIPIVDELSQVRSYLRLVEVSHKNWLSHQINHSTADFAVPPLSVQTIVENVVSRALDGHATKCAVTVSAGAAQYEYWISIVASAEGSDAEDSGRRRDPAIENVRTQLAAMCNGTLRVASWTEANRTVLLHLPRAVQ